MKTRESSIRISITVITVIVDTSMDPLAAIRSSFTGAAATTTTRVSAGSAGRTAVFTESVSRAGASNEAATSTLTPPETISVAVVRNPPAGTFQKSKSELRDLLLVLETTGHELPREKGLFEVGTSSSRASTVFHVSTLQGGASEVASESAGKGFNVQDSGSSTVERTRYDVTRESLTTAVDETTVHALSKTESVSKFVHHADHILFVEKRILSGFDKGSTDGSLTGKRSSGSTSVRTGIGVGNIRAGAVSGNEVDEISSDTVPENGRSRDTTNTARSSLPKSGNGVLGLESSGEVVNNRRNKIILDVRVYAARTRFKKTVVTVESSIGVTGEGSAGVVVTFGVEVFFNVHGFRFRVFLFIMGALHAIKGMSRYR